MKAFINRFQETWIYYVLLIIGQIGVAVIICYMAVMLIEKRSSDQQLRIDQRQEIQDLKAQIKKECRK